MVITAIAIDDEPIALQVIEAHATRVPFLQYKAGFTDAFKALEFLQREQVDLLFLDIKMPDISGIEFYNSLQKKPLVIFTTAYSEHAVAGFELDAVDYLLKPFSFARFLKGCNKAFELHNFRQGDEKPPDYLFIKTGYDQEKVLFEDILFLEASGNYVTFVLKNKNILSRSTFAEAIALLPPNRFVRIHRSFVVAIDKIEKAERHQLTIGPKKVPVSEAYSQDLKMALQKSQGL
jgi:DNA-binding LytR/AlgR family response regulator